MEVKKLECVGHYQKCVGTRLRKLKKTEKGLGGRGRLTDAVIHRLQNYFGVAIRQNKGNLEAMKAGSTIQSVSCSIVCKKFISLPASPNRK